jgi:TrmH family RNA methyltransferase
MITSKENELIKHIKSLNQKKFRQEYGEYFVEGVKLVEEAIEEEVDIAKIIICEELLNTKIDTKNYEVELVNGTVFKYISDTMTPQGILAVIKYKVTEDIKEDVIFALDDIRDPGNLGTIIRTLDCAGLKELLLSGESADAYNPKVVRSTMGAIYRTKIHEDINLKEKLRELKQRGYKIIVTALDTTKEYYDINFKEKCVILLGNESKGVSQEIQDLADMKVKIPMMGKTESLNAAVASAVIMYEYVRKSMKRAD